MLRRQMKMLVDWKKRDGRKPLIIRGARQVGKTWLMREFGRTQYQKYAYINFDGNKRMERLFDGELQTERLIAALQIESGVSIDPVNTLLVFDEVQEVPGALKSLKYFCENAPQYDIIAAGSLLGVAMHPGTSFPVGKVDFFDLHPMDYLEFLDAGGNTSLAELIRKQDWELIASFKDRFIELLKQYYFVGGMPEAVASFSSYADYRQVRSIQQNILAAYEQDFSKHAPPAIVPRIRMLWASLPAQLARENRKFMYGLVKQGARARDYELALAWLFDSGLVCKAERVSRPGMPLAAYQDMNAFKLFMHDVGLLAAMSNLDAMTILKGNNVFEEFKGALTEQYVHQQLVASCSIRPYYWSAEKSSGEIDFIIQHGSGVVPIEVKAAENLQAKSLKNFYMKYQPGHAIRTSMSDYREDGWLINIPLYAINALNDVLGM